MASPRGAEAYRRTAAQSSSPVQLVVMLYDGAIKFVLEARDAIARKDIQARTAAVSRALAIIVELQNTLNLKEGGDVARELDRLYTYINTRMLAVTRGDDEAAKEIHQLLRTLRDAWSQLATGVMAQAR